MASEQTNETGRANWRNTDMLRLFLETCVKEVSENGRQGGSLKSESWKRVRLALNSAFKVELTQRQLKNHYDYIKDKYQAWLPLTIETGNIYNPETHAITLTSAEWDEYIKVHPKAKTLRAAPLPFPDICRGLFDGIVATSKGGWRPSSRIDMQETASQVDVEVPGIDGLKDSVQEESFSSTPGVQSNTSTSCGQGARKKKKKCHRSGLDKQMCKWTQVKVDATTTPAAPVTPITPLFPSHASMRDCMEKLNRVGWIDTNPLYVAAVGIFCQSDNYRDAWMMMTDNPTSLEAWVVAVGSIIGFKF